MKRSKYSEEVIQFMIDNSDGRTNIELAELLNNTFNLHIDNDSVANAKSRILKEYGINLRNGLNSGRFEKGQISHNKGKKWSEYMSKEGQENSRKTCFKKGNKPSNAVPIGTEHIRYSKGDNIGFVCVKVADGKRNRNWVPKHRLIYEKIYGSIPRGYKVIFADGNRRNFDINNLILTSNAEELHLNKRGLRFQDKKLTETGLNIVKLALKVGEKGK